MLKAEVFVDAQVEDRLIITLKCSSLQILHELCKDYHAGHLNEIAHTFLESDEILKTLKIGENKLKLTTTIVEMKYKACQLHSLQWPGLYDRLIECNF